MLYYCIIETALSVMKRLIATFIILLSFLFSKAQDPKYIVRNYDDQYLDGNVWCAIQDTLGYMYFGIGDGISVYNGNEWQFVEIGNETTRCLFEDSYKNIWYGSVNDFGKIKKSKERGIYIESYGYLLAENKLDIGDIWSINELNGNLFFQARENIIVLNNNEEARIIKVENSYHRAFVTDSLYIINQSNKGLCYYNGGDFSLIKGGAFFKEKTISGSLPISKETILIGTRQSGVYVYNIITGEVSPTFERNKETIEFLKKNKLYSMVQLPKGDIAFATLLDGTIIVDKSGQIKRHLNSHSGTRDNKHYAIYLSLDNTLWMCSGIGCSTFNINSPLSLWDQSVGIEGSVYTLAECEKGLLAGGSAGLYYLYGFNERVNKIDKILNTEIWDLCSIEDDKSSKTIAIGSSDGLYKFNGEYIQQVFAGELILKVVQSHLDKNLLFAFTSHEILVFNIKNGISYIDRISGLFSEFRSVSQSGTDFIWIGTRTGQLLRVEQYKILEWLENRTAKIDVKKYNTGSITDAVNYQKQTFFTNAFGVFKYNQELDIIERTQEFGSDLYNLNDWILSLKEDDNGNIWLGGNKILLNRQDGSYSLYLLPYPEISNYKTASVFLHTDNNKTWFGGNRGLYLFDRSLIENKQNYASVIINKIITQDTIYHIYENNSINTLGDFIKQKNDFTIYYSLPLFEDEAKTMYSFLLEGYTKEWSNWSIQPFLTLTNLDPGKYTFKIKAKTAHGFESHETSIEFYIEKNWYQTHVAIALFVLLSLSILYSIIKLYTNARIRHELKIERIIQARLNQKYFIHFAEDQENKEDVISPANSQKDKLKQPESRQEKLINEVVDIIEANIEDSDFNVEKLCKVMELNQTALYRKVKSSTGISITAFMRKVRLKKALQLLASSDLTISEIAYQVGFNDPGYFTKCFTSEYGQSPSSFNNPAP